jgi:hypothetical protein
MLDQVEVRLWAVAAGRSLGTAESLRSHRDQNISRDHTVGDKCFPVSAAFNVRAEFLAAIMSRGCCRGAL